MTTLAPFSAEREHGGDGDAHGRVVDFVRPGHFDDLFKSVTALAAEKLVQEGLGRFRDTVKGLPLVATQTLVLRVAVTADPLLLWAIHLELDRRDVPPCLRWPANDCTPQAEFITWLADIHWFARRCPEHVAAFRGWRTLLAQVPATAKWHAHALRQFAYAYKRPSFAHWCAAGLGISDAQRQELMTMPTRAMQAARRAVLGQPFAELERELLDHAVAHPDRSGSRMPHAVASRRARMFRVHVLAGGAITRATSYWCLLTTEAITRQALAKQIDAVRLVTGR